jgi:hypothetical protein
MPEALSSIGSFVSGSGGKDLLAGAGLASNIASGVQNFQQQKQYSNAQSYLSNLIQNPAAFAAASQKYTQPLNQGLISSVTNATNANLAEKGLGGSSAITQATLAQALAPYIQQNQQAGQNALLSTMGMTGQLKPSGSNGFTDISKLLAQLKAGGGGSSQFLTPETDGSSTWQSVAPLQLDQTVAPIGTVQLNGD